MVEWKSIGEICYISDYVSNGSFASLRENVQYKSDPDYAILVRVADYSCGFDSSKFVYIDEHAYNFLAKSSLDGGEIIMSNVGSCGLLFRCPKLDRKMSLAPNAILIKSDYIDYLYYWLGSNAGQEEIKKITSKSAMPKFNKTEFKKIQIPIPSLSEQARIVGILDTFTASIDNLKEQIAERRKQYEHYRDKLLDLEGKEGLEMKTLGDIMQIVRGASPRPIKNYITTSKNGVNWIKIGDVSANEKYISSTNEKITKEGAEKSRYLKPGDFILSNSMSFGRPYILKIDGCIHDGWIAMSDFDDYVLPDYLYEYLNSDIIQKYWKMKANNGGAMTNLNSDIVKGTPIYIPSFEEQLRIVSILDTFEASIQNLEAQLKEREKQYEYYRNKLLTFE